VRNKRWLKKVSYDMRNKERQDNWVYVKKESRPITIEHIDKWGLIRMEEGRREAQGVPHRGRNSFKEKKKKKGGGRHITGEETPGGVGHNGKKRLKSSCRREQYGRG